MEDLTRNEELILLSIWRLADNAYGISIRKNVMDITGRKLHYGSLYNMLYKMVRKGLVTTENSGPESVKGGRSKVLYYLTVRGKNALKEAQEMNSMAWNGIPDFALDGDR